MNSLSRPADRWKTLHFSWIAFFLTFVVWFNLGAFKTTLGKAFGLSEAQLNTLLICNVALTISARIAIGMLVDCFGPRKVYTSILLFACIPCIACALATSYMQLVIARLLISCVGAGFVVGIRLVGEWFDAREIGWAEGIYGGLGNFGMAAAAFGLPVLALCFGGANGWRWAMAISGVLCAAYAIIFFKMVRDTPAGEFYRKPKKAGALLVNWRGELASLVLMQIPMVLCLGVLAWRLKKVQFLGPTAANIIYVILALLLVQQITKILRVNRAAIPGEETLAGPGLFFISIAAMAAVAFAACFAIREPQRLTIQKPVEIALPAEALELGGAL